MKSKLLIFTFIILGITNITASSTDCLWSTYRPGPYFGIRSIIPDSPLFGLMWYYPEKMDSVKSMRHFMEISDDISKYEWQAHNGCNYGKLKIDDVKLNISLQIEFFNEFSELNGNHWVVKIEGKHLKEFYDNKGIVIMWYISNPNNPDNKNFGIVSTIK